MVWCNMATVDEHGRPRSRILHPIWEGQTGWITTRRHSYKGKYLSANPYVSLAYITDIAKPLYVDCYAEWVDDINIKYHVWELVKNTPAPVGFDPAPIYGQVDERFGILKLTPWRIELVNLPDGVPQVWHA